MGLPNQVFKVTGNKIASMVFAEDAFRFSSKSFNSVEEFDESWPKALTLATKVEIKYSAIKSVAKEKPGKEVSIKYKGMAGLPSECVFSFSNAPDFETLATFLEKNQYFTRAEEVLSPRKAASPYIAGLLFTVGITIFCHYQAIEIGRQGLQKADEEASDAKVKLFNHFIAFIGDSGVWVIGMLIAGYVIFKIYKRYTNPPERIKFLAPNAG